MPDNFVASNVEDEVKNPVTVWNQRSHNAGAGSYDKTTGLWTRKFVHHKSDYIPYNKLKDKPKMNRVEYMEKLTQHKLAKWERKNPKPLDMFTEEVEKWKQQRETAEERLRDFVVSIYDKLKVTATIQTPGGPPYKDITIGTVKDTGDTAKTVEMANKIVKHARTVNKNILHAQLLNHKQNNYTLLAAA